MADDRPKPLSGRRSLIHEQWTRRIIKPAWGHQFRTRRVRIAALIEPDNHLAIFRIFRKRACDFHRCPDPNQREESSSRLAVETNAAMSVRHGPDKSFVKSIGRRELAPVSHRITSIRFALPSALFLFAVNREVAMRGWATRLADVSLSSH